VEKGLADMPNDKLLDSIWQVESSKGTNPARLEPNASGALGDYQLKPEAVQDIRRVFPSKYSDKSFEEIALDPVMARGAANDYLSVIQMHLRNKNIAPTLEALSTGYHSGMGNVARGTIGPKGLDYWTKIQALMEE